MPDESEQPDAVKTLRERAAHVRRLMTDLVFEADKRVLREYADELEARADELGRGGG